MAGQPANAAFLCSLVLDTPTLSLLGSSSSCTWTNTTQLSILLSSDAIISSFDWVLIRNFTILAVGGSPVGASGQVRVQQPDVITTPSLRLSGPSTVGSCDGIVSQLIAFH